MKVLVILGTRPEAIKLAPIIRHLRDRESAGVHTRVCATAQHRELLDQVLTLFGIVPDIDLDLMTPSQTPTQIAAAILGRLPTVFQSERPDWVLIQGDTTTVAATALAGFYHRIPVVHVEAGLRTYRRDLPFPEEINRRLAGLLAELHCAPTWRARRHLLEEGVPESCVLVTGNPVIDALHWAVQLPAPPLVSSLCAKDESQRIGNGASSPPHLLLVTAHRREHFGAPLERICEALRTLAGHYAGSLHIVYPVHPNPAVAFPVRRLLEGVPHITLVPPLNYLECVHLMNRAHMILTDSGGLQEEAPSLGKPVLVLRDVTERPEAVEAGTVRVIGTDQTRIVKECLQLLDDSEAYARMASAVNPYGDGRAAERITSALLGEPVVEFDPAVEPTKQTKPAIPTEPAQLLSIHKYRGN